MHIALCGYKGSGKSFAGEIIAREFGLTPASFADPIKDSIMKTFKLDVIEQYDVFKRTSHVIGGKTVSGRDIVRDHGMFARNANVDYFIVKMMENIASGPTVITDLRFLNEFKFCKKHDILTIQILADTESDGHESEMLPFTADYSIKNTFDELFELELINLVRTFNVID